MQFLRQLIFATAMTTVSMVSAVAQAPATPPPAVTAMCKDGTTWMGAHRSGACRGHHGVQAFNPTPAAPAPATPTPSTAVAVPTPTPPPTPVPVTPAPAVVGSSGGGAGQVWLNTSSHVYHCQGDRDYGHTKRGSYMTEAAARSAGGRPSRGKVCS